MLKKILMTSLFLILFGQPAFAHFGMIIPSRSMILNNREAGVTLDIAFAHPFSQAGMPMATPRSVFVASDGEKTDLALSPAKYLGEPAFTASYSVKKPGVYQFAVVPEPYYEPAEDSYIIHYAKTVIGAFGYEDGWDAPLGLPVEIVPLTRPFGNYAGNTFSGVVLKNGKPLAHADVEVEFLNPDSRRKAPNAYFETQLVKTDANGEFTFGIPWAGWWGFAALAEADDKIARDGEPKPVELGGILWLQFFDPARGE